MSFVSSFYTIFVVFSQTDAFHSYGSSVDDKLYKSGIFTESSLSTLFIDDQRQWSFDKRMTIEMKENDSLLFRLVVERWLIESLANKTKRMIEKEETLSEK